MLGRVAGHVVGRTREIELVLAALGVYFITMTATVVGLSQYDTRSADVIRAYGGGSWKVMRLVRLRGAIPDILGGLRIAAPNAVLGAILAEFGGGGRLAAGAFPQCSCRS